VGVYGERAQSEVVGSILLVAMIVLGISIIGAIVLGDIASREETVSAVVEGNATAGQIEFRHGGGDSIPTAELTVVVENESGAQDSLPFGEGTLTGANDELFQPGERWSEDTSALAIAISPGDRVRLRLVHEPTGALLFDGARTVG
jgi:flagellin-like protein